MSNQRALLGVRLKENEKRNIYIYKIQVRFKVSSTTEIRVLEEEATRLAQSFACEMKRPHGGRVFGNQDSNEKSAGRGKRIEVESIL